MEGLFREEVTADRPDRLHGHIIMRLSSTSQVLVIALVAIVVAGAALVTTGQYSRTQTVRGILITSDPSIQIFPPRPGLVSQFHLNEGDQVVAGQALAVIDTDIVSQGGQAVAGTVARSMDQRLSVAQTSAGDIRDKSNAVKLAVQERIASIDRQMESLRSQVALGQQIVSSNQKMFDMLNGVADRGFVSQVEYERRRQNVLASVQNVAHLQQSMEEMANERDTAREELAKTQAETQQELAQLNGSIGDLQAERARSEGERSYVIRAPISGKAAAVLAATGRRADPTAPLFTIIPTQAKLRARLFAPSSAIGMVKPHQHTTLLLDAFPYQRFGSISAEIIDVSRTVIDPKSAEIPFQAQEPVYLIEATLDRQSMSAFGQQIPLQPGMTLTANIVLEKQSFLDWMLAPLRAVLNRT